jgi:nucleotide-binding universal stress UspA family protein
MYHAIVVPLDGSEFGERALPLALSIASDAGATIQLLHVCAAEKQEHRDYLQALAARIEANHGLSVSFAMVGGHVPAEIQHAVARSGGDLVVMATHARGPLGRLWFGSVAEQLIHSLGIPILLVNPHENGLPYAREHGLRRILVPLDGSELAEEILGPAAGLAASQHASLILLSSVEQFGDHLIAASSNPPTSLAARQAAGDIEEYMAGITGRLRELSVRFEVKLVDYPHPGMAIVASADDFDADVIAIATHGRGGLSRFLFGSVAAEVIRDSHKPVLVFRPTGVREPKLIVA